MLTRRGCLAAGSALALLGKTSGAAAAEPKAGAELPPLAGGAGAPARGPFLLGLNTSTIRGQKLSIVEELAIAEKAGYGGMEPWLDELERFEVSGGDLNDLGKRFRDAGISVESAIAFFEWAVDDPARRKRALEAARRGMERIAKVGGKRLAAPPAGATGAAIDARALAERYRALLDLGAGLGVVPQVEIWGFSKCLGRLGEAAQVAIEADHPDACILPDVYHLHRGGSGPGGVKFLAPRAIHVFHVNDYPGDRPREALNDADRVYPGEGAAPLAELTRDLAAGGFRVMLSLELFNPTYWKHDPLEVARTGLARMKALVAGAE